VWHEPNLGWAQPTCIGVSLAKRARLNNTAHTGPTIFDAHETFPHQSRPPNFNSPKKIPPTFPRCRCSSGPTTPVPGTSSDAAMWAPASPPPALLCTNPGTRTPTRGTPSHHTAISPSSTRLPPLLPSSASPTPLSARQKKIPPTTGDELPLAARRSSLAASWCALWRGRRGRIPLTGSSALSPPRCRVPPSRF
jgi:hypothetical protein